MIDNLLKDLTDKTILKEVSKIIAEKMFNANESIPEPKPISSLTRKIHGELILFRVRLLYIVFGISFYSFTNLFFTLPFGIIFSIITLIGGLSLVIILFLEVFKGAGSQIEIEYENNGLFSRSYKFIPSINKISKLILFVVMGFIHIIVGFSGIYLELSRMNKAFFNIILDGVTSLYFSIVTFATVGFGDILPEQSLSRIIVSFEIMIAMILVSIVIATTISWVTINERERYEEYLKKREEDMKKREELIQIAKLGHYGDVSELVVEAKKRITEQNK